jgi:hypothetical protein
LMRSVKDIYKLINAPLRQQLLVLVFNFPREDFPSKHIDLMMDR